MSNSKKTLENIINAEEVNLSEMEKENYILKPLLKEIEMIEDEPIRMFVRSVLLRAGAFWDMPSSYNIKFSPPDEHAEGGNIIHVKRVIRIVDLLCESYGYIGYDRDMLIAAALLHDVTKGIQIKDNDEIDYDIMYPYTIDKFVKFVRLDDQTHASEDQSSTLFIPEEAVLTILKMIHSHMGLWSPIPETYPSNTLEWLLHTADHVATKLHYIIDGDDVKMERWLLI